MRYLLITCLTFLLLTPAAAQDATPSEDQSALEAEAPADPAEDLFALDPALAFEAFFAGNYARAFDLAITFAGRDDAPSMRLLGQLYGAGLGVEQDEAEAAQWFRLAAQAGDNEARMLLATMIMDGIVIERDEAEAATLLQQAVDENHIGSTQMLGMLYLEGRGVERNINRGAQLMQTAADQGDVTALYTLGILYAEGAGVRQDTSQAYLLFEQAARRGNPEAQIELALGLLRGEAGEEDLSQERRIEDAIFWLKRAAESGNPVAENRLAHAYSQGYGVPLDPVQAAFFHARAVAGGLADARLDSFVSSLPEDQRQEAQNLMAQYRAPANPFDRQR